MFALVVAVLTMSDMRPCIQISVNQISVKEREIV